MKMKRVLSLLLALVMTFSLLTLPSYAEDEDTVTVTVNYVYDSNKTMVAQPDTEQLAKGAEFKKDISVPTLLNYSVPADMVEGLDTGITFANNTLSFDLASVTSDVTVTLHYVAGQAEYTITYDANGGTLAGAGQVKYTVNDAITLAAAPTREGYNFTGWKLDADAGNWTAGDYTAQQAVDAGKYGNVTFVAQWQEKTATINYAVKGPEGCGSVDSTSETVKFVTGTATGSTATASSDNYKFVGWYSDPECQNPVPAAQVAGNKFTPAKDAASGLYVPATYYAKFEWNVADLTITKTGCQEVDENQSFIFHVTGDDNDVDMYVTVQGAGSVTIKDLLVGSYTVEEMTSWSWRYTPDEGGAKDVTVNGGVENTVTFTNIRTNLYWLSGENFAINAKGEVTAHGTFVSGN